MRFVKMHGLANDFVVVAADEPGFDPEMVAALCDRRTGVGADGVLRVGLDGDTVTMDYWNADGTPAEMCGNGLRCVARYAHDRGLVAGSRFTVRTPDGPRRVSVADDDRVTVEIGSPAVGDTVSVAGSEYRRVSVGNPHAVRVVEDVSMVDVAGIGRVVETHPLFPAGTNVEFVEPSDDGVVHMRVWERGVGETMACGTGMVATAAVYLASAPDDAPLHRTEGSVMVTVPGGTGRVDLDVDGVAWLTGPAVTVFAGDWV